MLNKKDCDFSGWVTRYDVQCSDGRTIKPNAFKECNGLVVPLVWNHNYDDCENVLGHTLLENRPEGVYGYGFFNDTETGKNGKELVNHGDITGLSIFANKLKQNQTAPGQRDVYHGKIREVSLVLAGANPGAYIDTVMAHSDSEDGDEEAIIYFGENLCLKHSDEEEKIIEEKKEEIKMPEEKEIVTEEKKIEETSDKTVGEVFDTLTEEQKNAVYAIIGKILEDNDIVDQNDQNEDVEEKITEEDEEMKVTHNIFEGKNEENTLTHDEMATIFNDAKRMGSLKESFLSHADEYGITDIGLLFPDYKNVIDTPEFVKTTPDEWVSVVMNGVKHTPFSRIKSMFADITAEDARAKGYTKGGLKIEEVFGLLGRTTDPTTVYKKQKLDRDDVIDITDFDVVAWLKGEMRGQLDEEIARAILFGDGRTNLDPDKIKADKIRPIISDASFYTIEKTVTVESGEEVGHALVNAAVTAQDNYKGSGSLTAFIKSSSVTSMLLLEDTVGHRLYKNLEELATAMNVSRVVRVPDSIVPEGYYGIAVDLRDYNVGADKGGAVSMFDDFDIDFNQQKYLIETRCSGAMVRPYGAIAFKVAG